MSDSRESPEADAAEAARAALRVGVSQLPHLGGLAQEVWVQPDPRVATAGVFASGRILVNPSWFLSLSRADQSFVMVHELLHLALGSHDRATPGRQFLFNIAHDLIINDILHEEVGWPVPPGALWTCGTRHRSAESIVIELEKRIAGGEAVMEMAFPLGSHSPETDMGRALRLAGLTPDASESSGGSEGPPCKDVLEGSLERDWFPGDSGSAVREERIRHAVARGLGIKTMWERMERVLGRGDHPSGGSAWYEALGSMHRPPWERALQRSLGAFSPSARSFARPSRRGADRTDAVLPGRRREGWTLNVILDTSGSMDSLQPVALGAIAAFCREAGIEEIRIVQCDAEVARDQVISPEDLTRYQITGLGGSDMTPAMAHLAADPSVEAVVVVTDGFIGYPEAPPPYAVVWTLTTPHPWVMENFRPTYGLVVQVEGR